VFQVSENTELRFENDFELPYTDTAELKSNQSVRATIRLSEKTILALSIVSNQLGVKQKSLFDHLISDTDALETIARELKKSNQKNLVGIQKTFVISRKTLSILKKMAKDHKASRGALVEFSIQRLKPIIGQEKSKLESRRIR
jgi:flagellar biosynthesis/type III secretory pathway chaperone